MIRSAIWWERLGISLSRCAQLLLLVLAASGFQAEAQVPHLEATLPIGPGLHPWYEILSDPEEPATLIICGTKWDALTNGPLGVVYASSDAGRSWHVVLEDRNSAWVTEHSCAFGTHHRAYFISEASKVIDGEPHHELGTTRLFCSTDGGRHWSETVKTGWADYSTSAVNRKSGELYTFFQATWTARERGRGWGNNLGVLVFSPDGKKVSGPFFNRSLRNLDYRGIYPSNAIALNSGAVVALYYARRVTPSGWQIDLGIARVTGSLKPELGSIVISHPVEIENKNCTNFFRGSMTYDPSRNRLYVIYTDGCADKTRTILTSSDDEGRTWTGGMTLQRGKNAQAHMDHLSLVASPTGELGLLWSEGSASTTWFFSYILGQKISEPPLELAHQEQCRAASSDSLWTWVNQPGATLEELPADPSLPSISLNIRNLSSVWRATGLVQVNDKFMAIWPSESQEGSQLTFGILGNGDSRSKQSSLRCTGEKDVTSRVRLLYGGNQDLSGQYFDNATSTLRIYLTLANRGREPIRAPVKLLARGLSSQFGAVSVLNATNGFEGPGAVWDISDSLTGDQIPPGVASNPFCLSFHVQVPPERAVPPSVANLLSLKVSVFAGEEDVSKCVRPLEE